ncbi:hypothetical protein D9M71_721910 [compost metagenome]
MQEEDRRVGRDRVDLVDRRQALFGELMFGETADDAHPLRRRRDRHLTLQHVHGVGQRTHPIPAQFHVVVQAATDDMGMVVDQAGQDPLAFQIDDFRIRSRQGHDLTVGADRHEQAILDGDRGRNRVGAVERGDQPVMKNGIGMHLSGSGLDGIGGMGR